MRHHRLVAVFSATLFLSASLLFCIQPMFGKMILPLLGGVPAVWNTAMLFYQAVLLIGYGYAHLTSRWLRPPAQAGLHLLLMVAAMAALPIAIPAGWTPPAAANPLSWLLMVLTVAVGAPFAVLSATAPMLQRWFASTRHPDASHPYFLYAVSNVGSLAALLAYPLLLEPNLALAGQSGLWSLGFVVLLGLVALSAWLTWRERRPESGVPDGETAQAAPTAYPRAVITGRQRLLWVALAFAPSSLMLGLTTYVTTDIAAVPLLWVIPLTLYLATFIIAFANRPLIPHRVAVWLQPFLVLPLAFLMALGIDKGVPGLALPLHGLAFFFTALVCHGELARRKPPAADLTEFYFWLSLGGVLGGAFNTLAAPLLFTDILEYPLILAAACALRPAPEPEPESESDSVPAPESALAVRRPRALPGWLITVALVGAFALAGAWFKAGNAALCLMLVAAAIFALFTLRRQPLALGTGLSVLLMAGLAVPPANPILLAERNFYGAFQVRDLLGGSLRVLQHGNTLHGSQAQDPAYRREPLAYYSRFGGIGDVFAEANRRGGGLRVGAIGLGAGSVVCHSAPGRHFTFFEINPAVARVATTPALFSFLADCGTDSAIVLGDGRLTLRERPAGSFDLIVLDAFSSDSVPVHLLTREALAMYFEKLAPGGMIVLNLSNRYLSLELIVGAAARDLGLTALLRKGEGGVLPGTAIPYYPSIVAVMARSPADLGALPGQTGWTPLIVPGNVRSWSDDFSNLLAVLGRQ